MIRQWWRKVAGPTRADLRAEVDAWRGRADRQSEQVRQAHRERKAQRAELNAQLTTERDRVRQLKARLRRAEQALALTAAEPERGECTKVRFHHRGGAETWALQILADTEGVPGSMKAYQCREGCPRSPVTMQRYWHVGHQDTPEAQLAKEAARARREQRYVAARRDGRTLGQQIDPRVMARMRQMTGGRP